MNTEIKSEATDHFQATLRAICQLKLASLSFFFLFIVAWIKESTEGYCFMFWKVVIGVLHQWLGFHLPDLMHFGVSHWKGGVEWSQSE